MVVRSVDEWERSSKEKQREQKGAGAEWDYFGRRSYGFSGVLAWIVIVVYALVALIFLIASRKHKGMDAATREFEQHDRPIYTGR